MQVTPIALSRAAPEPAPRPQRLDWIDVLRGLATVLVILLHACLVVRLYDLKPWPPLAHFNHLFTPFRMALLILLSGMLVPRALTKPPLTYLRRKTGTLLYPFILWTVIYSLVIDPARLLDHRLWIGGSYLWFILFLFTYYVWALLLQRVPPVVVILAAALLSLLSPENSKYEERYFFLMCFFFLGYQIARTPSITAALADRRLLWVCAPIAALLALASTLQGGINYKIELFIPVSAALVLLVGLGPRYGGASWLRPLRFVGRNSVVFFAMHYPMIYLLIGLCLALGIGSIPLISAICTVVPVGLCLVAAWARERQGAFDYLYALPL